MIAEIQRLGPLSNTYTFVSAAHGSTSWLDHCLCNPNLNSIIKEMRINYDISVNDNMPLVITFLLRPLEHVFSEPRSTRRPRLCWKAANAQDLTSYNQFISAHLEPFLATIIYELRCACAPNSLTKLSQNKTKLSHREPFLSLQNLYRSVWLKIRVASWMRGQTIGLLLYLLHYLKSWSLFSLKG